MNEMRQWVKAAAIRAIKTAAQTAVGVIGAATVMGNVDWLMVGSASLLAAVVSVLTSVAGIPEVAAGKSVAAMHLKVDEDGTARN